MATRKQLEAYANNPKVRKFLDLIAHTEGTEGNGYRTAFGGSRLSSLSDHPRYLKSFKQQNGKTNKTSAAGRYQFLTKTWDGLARQYGLNDFSPRSQDLGAVALLVQNGALGSVLKGDWQSAVKKAGPTWASLPSAPKSYSQPTRSWNSVAKFMGDKGFSSLPQQQEAQPLGTDWNAFKSGFEEQSKPLGNDFSAFKADLDGVEPMAKPEPLGTDFNAFRSQLEAPSTVEESQPAIQPLGNDWNSFKAQLEQPQDDNIQNQLGDNYGSRI